MVTEGRKGTLFLAPPKGQKLDRITAEYLDFEKPEEENLATWAENFFALGLGPSLTRTFTPVSLDVKDPDGRSQQVHLQYRSAVPGEVYLITRGRLVLQILTDSDVEAIVSQLRIIANSVEFSIDGPVNQEQLSSPAEPPAYTTIEAWQQRVDDTNLASDAVSYRLQTGEVAHHLLAMMSERARQDYERMMVNAADYIAAIDRQREEQNSPGPFPTPDPGPNSTEYFEQERIYNEGLGKHIQEDTSTQAGLETATTALIRSAATNQDEIANRRGVPTRYTTPIRTYPATNVRCSSGAHVDKDTYAIDILVNEGTAVYGTTQDERVTSIVDSNTGWGKYVWTESQQYVRGFHKTYYQVYAHLSQIYVGLNDTIQPTTIIGLSGNTGNSSDPHLHYQIHTHHDIDGNGGVYRPVDLSPVKGFVHDLDYPISGDCGDIENPANTPIIIEANEFQFSVQPVASGHNWSCSTHHPNHTGSCYRAAIPITPNWSLTPLNSSNVHLTPRVSYQVWFPTNTNYRVWVCGMGGHIYDDSLHISPGGLYPGTADDMTGYQSTNWVWASLANDGSTPYLLLPQGYNDISMYIRENGMRVDRILLTKNFGYIPTTAGIRCGAQGL